MAKKYKSRLPKEHLGAIAELRKIRKTITVENTLTRKQLAEIFGIGQSTIIYWQEQFGFPKAAETLNGKGYLPKQALHWALNQAEKMKGLLTLPQAAAHLGLPEYKVRRWAKAGKLPAPKICASPGSANYLWDVKDLDEWLMKTTGGYKFPYPKARKPKPKAAA